MVQASGATTAYRIDVSSDGAVWTPFGDPVAASGPAASTVTATPVTARYVGYTAQGPAAPHVVSLEVYTG